MDLVFSGWSHALPRAGALELVVAVLPPALCPWLANKCVARGADVVLCVSCVSVSVYVISRIWGGLLRQPAGRAGAVGPR